MNDKNKKILFFVGITLLIAVFVAALITNQTEPTQTETDEPLAATSELDNDPSFFGSEQLEVAVTSPEGSTAEEPTPEPTTPTQPVTPTQPSTPAPTPPPVVITPPPVVERPPPSIGPGDPQNFEITEFESNNGPLANQNALLATGWWSVDSTTQADGANSVRVFGSLNSEPSTGSYSLVLFLQLDNQPVFLALQDSVSGVGGQRGAFFQINGGVNGESPSGNVYGGGTTGSVYIARLINWQVGSAYEFIVEKDVDRSDGQNNWWSAYIKNPGGSSLLIGHIQVPASTGTMRLDSTYMEWSNSSMSCNTIPNTSASFYNMRNDSRGSYRVGVSQRLYSDCDNVYSFSQFGTNGFSAAIGPGS